MQPLKRLLDAGRIEYLDLAFARLLQRRFGESNPRLLLAAALASRVTWQGHVCLDLGCLEEQLSRCEIYVVPQGMGGFGQKLIRDLAASSAVGRNLENKPLILSGSRLYLKRYFNYEMSVARSIEQRCGEIREAIDTRRLSRLLDSYFSSGTSQGINWQKVAGLVAACKGMCIVSGGPGTGKTYTVARMIAVLLHLFAGRIKRVFLAAPTGKAAARLQESLGQARGSLELEKQVAAYFPEQAATIHRMIGISSDGLRVRYNASNPLPADLVVVDEASMVDLALMYRLLDALLPETRLILLGDKDQLASVEAGAVLGDLCNSGGRVGFSRQFALQAARICGSELPAAFVGSDPCGCLTDHVVVLKNTYRFDPSGGIGALVRAINEGDAGQVLRLLADPDRKSLEWVGRGQFSRFLGVVEKAVVENFRFFFEVSDPVPRLSALERFRILCAVKQGPWGTEKLNIMAEKIAVEKGWIPTRYLDTWPWYPGRPVMILRNDFRLQLFNGDSGVASTGKAGNGTEDFRVDFPAREGQVRRLPVYRLPALETAYATTVHRSQGSEFDRVLIVLPDKDNPLLSRELLYTAVSRARSKVSIWASEEILVKAIRKRLHRASGLKELLWS